MGIDCTFVKSNGKPAEELKFGSTHIALAIEAITGKTLANTRSECYGIIAKYTGYNLSWKYGHGRGDDTWTVEEIEEIARGLRHYVKENGMTTETSIVGEFLAYLIKNEISIHVW